MKLFCDLTKQFHFVIVTGEGKKGTYYALAIMLNENTFVPIKFVTKYYIENFLHIKIN